MSTTEAAPQRRTRRRWLPWVAWAGVFGLYAATAAREGISLDVWSANFASWQVATLGDPTFAQLDEPPLVGHPIRDIWVVQDAAGRDVIGRSPGVVAVGVPAYWIAQQATMTLLPGALTAALLVTLALVLFHSVVRVHLSARESVLATAVLGFTTPMWSVAADGVWPHTVTAFGLLGMAWAAQRGRWWLAGLFGAVTLWGRLHAAVLVAVFGLLLGWWRRSPRPVLAIGLVSALGLAGVSAWSRWYYGTWDPMASYDSGYFADYAAGHRLDLVNHLGMWLSPGRGLFVWTPVALLLLPALVRRWRHLPDWSRALLLAGLAYTVLQGVLNRFQGGDTYYAYRLMLEMLVCAAPALALSVDGMGRVARRLLGPVLVLQAVPIVLNGILGYRSDVAPSRAWREYPLWRDLLDRPDVMATSLAVALLLVLLVVQVLRRIPLPRWRP